MAKETGTYERAAVHVKGIGESLEKVADRDMLLHGFAVSQRSMLGDDKTFVGIRLSTVDDPETVVAFHAWSDSLADKLRDLPAERADKDDTAVYTLAKPMLITFKRVATSGGFRVWSFE